MQQVFLNMKPNWATVVSNKAGLIEVEINDKDPGFHSIIEKLSTEIQTAIVGVKASDLCQTIVDCRL